MKLVVTGGGTGGHVYPALSVAELLGTEHVDYIGSATGPEARLATGAGFRFHPIPSRKMSASAGLGSALSLGTAAAGLAASLGLLRGIRPDVVFGTGGYAAGPVVLGAVLLRIPTLIHEGNAVPGRTNRWLSRFVSKVAICYEDARPYFPGPKVVFTGFPVRASMHSGDRARARAEFNLSDRPLLFAFGGSLGARSINKAVIDALPLLEPLGIHVLHQTGKSELSLVSSSSPPPPPWYRAVPYVTGMADALAAATLVVCRCGASTLSEVAAAGCPALLVPYPHAQANHQARNAESVVASGAAVLIPDAELSGQRLASEVRALMEDPDRRSRMGRTSRGLARPDAAARVLEVISDLAVASRVSLSPAQVANSDG